MSDVERPKIQIDDVVRDMTDEEYEAYLEYQASFTPLTIPE